MKTLKFFGKREELKQSESVFLHKKVELFDY